MRIKSCYVEADFLSSSDGVIVASHEYSDAGKCGAINRLTWLELKNCHNLGGKKFVTLKDFLSMPLSEWFIDLKSTQSSGGSQAASEISKTIEQINNSNMKKGAVLMIYNLPPEALALVKKHNIRAGLKGYPSNTEEALKMIDSASEMGLEMVCISEHLIDENLLAYAKKSDIWLLPWTASKPKPERWQKMVDWGAGGLITAWVGWSTENLKAY